MSFPALSGRFPGHLPFGPERKPMRSKSFWLHHLDHRDSTILKGLAIVAIVLHNFFHFVSPAQQNEFVFHPGAFDVFLQELRRPSHSIQAFFSFFGHFGVQIFIFLSAYGLAKSHWEDQSSWTQFMWGRIKKLYPTFLLIIVPWVFAMAVWGGPYRLIRDILPSIAATILGVSTLVGFDLPPVGPWWFIPFIMQFYAIWFLLRWVTRRFGWRGLLAVAAAGVVVTYVLSPLLAHRTINLLTTPVGRLPTICFGIVAARYRVRISGMVAAAGIAILVLGSIYPAGFLFTPFAALLALLWGYICVRDVVLRSGILLRIGEISMLIFLLNAIVRNQLVRYAISPGQQLYWGFLSAALSIAISNLIARLLQPATAPVSLSVGDVPDVPKAGAVDCISPKI